MIVGTSLSVYPAASLATEAKQDTEIVLVDPSVKLLDDDVDVISKKATVGVPEIVSRWLK